MISLQGVKYKHQVCGWKVEALLGSEQVGEQRKYGTSVTRIYNVRG